MDPAVLLARAELFRALDADVVQQVASDARSVTLQRNDLIFSEGDEAAELYVVRSGRIAIAKRSADGRESVVALMEDGEAIGEMILFDSRGRSARAGPSNPELVTCRSPRCVRSSRNGRTCVGCLAGCCSTVCG